MAPETHKGAGELPEVVKLDACKSPVPKNLRSKTEQACNWSLTEQHVDPYIHTTESEPSHGRDRRPGCPDHEHVATQTKEARPTDSFSLFWGFVVATVGCFWWLAKTISKALN